MDTANEIYIFVSAILLAIIAAKKIPVWTYNIYKRSKKSKNFIANVYNNLYEIFVIEGA